MKRYDRIFVFFIVSFPLAASNFSAAQARSPWKDAPTYREQALQKFDFGAMNFLAGWTEIISQPFENYKQKNGKRNKFVSLFPGFGKGLLFGMVNTAGGFLHAATAPATMLDIPLPENGVHFKEITGGDLIAGPRAELSSAPSVTERTEKQPAASL